MKRPLLRFVLVLVALCSSSSYAQDQGSAANPAQAPTAAPLTLAQAEASLSKTIRRSPLENCAHWKPSNMSVKRARPCCLPLF